ncbi:MAG: 3-isopropylmalate dehydratase large subunit, partial [Alphaproteobacteria bacterium]|nr:3-isopropylmalate dehydratase large subunit [Alphaproteobacteria bacterium]
MPMAPKTLFEKIWDRHVVVARDDGQTLLYIDRHLCHDGSFHGFSYLREQGRSVRRPAQTFATPDHYTPTDSPSVEAIADPTARQIVTAIDKNCADFGVTLFPWGDRRQGIAHVVGPEQGITLPGLVMVCGDSHTSTHGALGCVSFGIGASEVAHVLATQTLWQKKPETMRITVDGKLGPGVTAKDVIIAIIRQIGAAGGVGHAIEYAGEAIEGLSIEGRLTLCNMSIEAGARCGMVAPDDKTFDYIEGRPFAPKGEKWERALAYWRSLPSDAEARFDAEVSVDGSAIAPMVTWGNSPQDAVQITDRVPDPAEESDAERRDAMTAALDYMDLTPGTRIDEVTVDRVFIGSCT